MAFGNAAFKKCSTGIALHLSVKSRMIGCLKTSALCSMVEKVLHASGGVALYPDHALQWDALLHCADTAMYASKQAGSHQIRLYQVHAEAALLARAEVAAQAVVGPKV